jgi:hypothetical protein
VPEWLCQASNFSVTLERVSADATVTGLGKFSTELTMPSVLHSTVIFHTGLGQLSRIQILDTPKWVYQPRASSVKKIQ